MHRGFRSGLACSDAVADRTLERWVGEQAGGLIVIAGPIYSDALAQDRRRWPRFARFIRSSSTAGLSILDDGRYGSKEPWPLEFTRDGSDAEFLWIEESGPASAQAWSEFKGVYGYYGVKGPKPAATVYCTLLRPSGSRGRSAAGLPGRPVLRRGPRVLPGQRRDVASAQLERGVFRAISTPSSIRFVSQGRLLRGSNHGVLLVERDRYLLGNTVAVRAQLNGAQLDPLVAPQVTLQVYLPDTTATKRHAARPIPSRPGNFAGQFMVRKEGVYRLELPVPEMADERLTRRIQVKVPDLEREKPQRNDALLNEIAAKTGGSYYVGPATRPWAAGPSEGPLVKQLRDQSRLTIVLDTPDRLWDNWWMLSIVCGSVLHRMVDPPTGQVGIERRRSFATNSGIEPFPRGKSGTRWRP